MTHEAAKGVKCAQDMAQKERPAHTRTNTCSALVTPQRIRTEAPGPANPRRGRALVDIHTAGPCAVGVPRGACAREAPRGVGARCVGAAYGGVRGALVDVHAHLSAIVRKCETRVACARVRAHCVCARRVCAAYPRLRDTLVNVDTPRTRGVGVPRGADAQKRARQVETRNVGVEHMPTDRREQSALINVDTGAPGNSRARVAWGAAAQELVLVDRADCVGRARCVGARGRCVEGRLNVGVV